LVLPNSFFYSERDKLRRKAEERLSDSLENDPVYDGGIDSDTDNVIDQIRNGTGKYAHTKRKTNKHDQDTQDTSPKNLSSDNSSGSNIMGIVMAFIGIAIMLLVAMLILGAVENQVIDPNYGLNQTADYPQHEYKDPFDVLLDPIKSITDSIGMPIWVIIPIILFVIFAFRKVF